MNNITKEKKKGMRHTGGNKFITSVSQRRCFAIAAYTLFFSKKNLKVKAKCWV